ncbi:hypothetical protein IU448_15625 [Nocardia flavorosea]|uniref:hypothetical protein n=1 Tax=Nocardia flavorosea TaxID=53429 RepID=UPI0018940982|nr:hypothetical protein [Nocardia flavorosea]MBF6350434.1 hypothetical protein [Nocardia flavorosea]
MVSTRGFLATLAICTALSVTACGDTGDTGAEPGPPPTPSAAPATGKPPSTPPEDPAADPGRIFTADPTIVGAHPIPITSWTRVGDDRIAVHFETGVPECYGVDASVTETETTVTVELRGGTRADATGKMCVMMAVFGTLEVQLDTPLADRQVLSAA